MSRFSTQGLTAGVRRALTFWRRSIQARVVASTLLLSAVVVSVVGWFLLQQTKDGLLDQRVEAVVAEARGEVREAEVRLEAASVMDPDATRQQVDLVDPIIDRGQDRDFSVVLAGPAGESLDLEESGAVYTAGLDIESVPTSMVERFDEAGARTAWTYTRIVTEDDGTTTERPGIVVGSQVRLPADGQTYTLFFLFPLEEQQETLGLVTRALLTAAVLLLVLVAGLTWLVTRQVVTPIRMARRVAERLAAGRLQERLRVSGEDDLARLATSFNQMASNLQRQIRQLEELSLLQRRFVSDVSHELRTPLTTVRMAGDVLHDARQGFDPATARAAELLQTELDRFETLLVDLLEVSRFDAGAALLDTDDVNLVDVVHRVVDATQPLADQRGVRVTVEAPGHACLAEAD
jgi:two-component system sensor histidine kinase MtrB